MPALQPSSPLQERSSTTDRLPWLSDEPKRPSGATNWELLIWIASATLLIAGASYWAGSQSVRHQLGGEGPRFGQLSVPVPQPRAADGATGPAQESQVPAAETASDTPVANISELKKAPQPPVPSGGQSQRRASPRTNGQQDPAPTDPYELWPADKIEGASGRLVRIGSFGTEADARAGWDSVLQGFPAMRRLPVKVQSGKSLRNSETFYRIQVGTSSHAHSEVACQRARSLGLQCDVVGLVVGDKAGGASAER